MPELLGSVLRRLAFGCSAALLIIGSPAMAQDVANTFLQLDFVSAEKVESGALLSLPQGYPDASLLRLGAGFDAGAQQLQIFGDYEATPAGTPFSGLLFGLTTLDPSRTVQGGSDASALHLVLGLDTVFSSSVVGRDFATAFADFTTTYRGGDNFPDYYAGDINEADFIDQLLFESSLSGQYGRPYRGTNLLFDFGSYLADKGGTLSDGRGLSLIAFSIGQGIGTGTVQALDVPASAVPEPASWALMILGFGIVGGALRFRSRMTSRATLA